MDRSDESVLSPMILLAGCLYTYYIEDGLPFLFLLAVSLTLLAKPNMNLIIVTGVRKRQMNRQGKEGKI
jgi:hypothetical protein